MYGLDGDTYKLLQESSVLMDKWADEICKAKHKGGMEEWAKEKGITEEAHDEFSCDWYHGTWQYLRLLNMVAVPNWYLFYNETLTKVLKEKPKANLFISACADYGMLAKVHEAIIESKSKPTITIYDICETPLKSCEWYADLFNLKIKIKKANIITDEIPEAPFDIIVTDEFLSVLKSEYKPMIIDKWKKIIKPDGYIITTAMIGKPTEKDNREFYANKAKQFFDMYGKMLFPDHHENGNAEDLLEKFQKFAEFHTRHMIKDEMEIKELFKDFKVFQYSILPTPGECINPTNSYQIVARLK
jgi:hypothetical protein